ALCGLLSLAACCSSVGSRSLVAAPPIKSARLASVPTAAASSAAPEFSTPNPDAQAEPGASGVRFSTASTSRLRILAPSQATAQPASVAIANPLAIESNPLQPSAPPPAAEHPASGAPVSEPSAAEPPAIQPGVLDGRSVAQQAACCWPLARLLDQRAATLDSQAGSEHTAAQRSAALQSSFLRRQAARQRDIAAANALRAYYSWIANRLQLEIVAEGFDLHSQQAATQASLIERGVAIDDPTELDRKRLELRDSQLQLQAADTQLDQALLRLTCCASDVRGAIVESLEIQPAELDCDQLAATALELRQDYLAYVELCQHLDEQTARSISDLLAPLAGGVGVGMFNSGLLSKLCLAAGGAEALQHVARELRIAIDLERRLVQQTVCEKCQALALAYERVQIAQQVVASWQERIAALERLEELGEARGQALNLARAELLQARSTLVSRQLSARLAEIDLAEAMGGLAARCCRGEPWLYCWRIF
ncbi:MAG: hypothetical protein ACTHOU_20435, partial [Aureliella sp.]